VNSNNLKQGSDAQLSVFGRCEKCAAEKTPLQFAFDLLGVHRPAEQLRLLRAQMPHGWREANFDTWLMAGWVDGQSRDISDGNPFDVLSKDQDINFRAWLVGLIAAQYALAMGWMSIDCRYSSRDGHKTPVELYLGDVEKLGEFPTDSLHEHLAIRGMAQAFLDNSHTVNDLAKVVALGINSGALVLPASAQRFDPNPTIDGRDIAKSYETYIKDVLDVACTGWYWTNDTHMAPEIRREARMRRSVKIAELSMA